MLSAAMRAAIDAASSPTLRTKRNPRVGCTLISAAGEVLVTSAHHGPGTPHAEAAALGVLRDKGRLDDVRGGTAVVTLEPCNHTGNTPPCSNALLDAGVAKVVYGVDDPNPQAAGGAEFLRASGIEVVSGFLEDECRAIDPRWLSAAAHQRPHVTFKYAATLDGKTAAADGTSQWITSSAARDLVHTLRADHDAIAAGTGTVLADDPRLTVRGALGEALPPSLQPLRVVIGERDIPAGFNVHDDHARTVFIPERDPISALKTLWDLGVRRLFLEGGAQIAGAFFEAGVVDEVHAFIAPILLGAGTPVVADVGVSTLADALRWEVRSVNQIGPDVHITYTPPKEA